MLKAQLIRISRREESTGNPLINAHHLLNITLILLINAYT